MGRSEESEELASEYFGGAGETRNDCDERLVR